MSGCWRPTWIAVNAAIGLWTSQSIFQLVRPREPRFIEQRLMSGASPLLVSAGLAIGMLVFLAGLVYWGNRFKKLRRTTIIFYGLGGGAVLVAAAVAINHGASMPVIVTVVLLAPVVGGLFVLAGATPAALGLLADMSEPYPHDRGAIMGLYSVFLALGQITGSIAGGAAADAAGIDGLLVATLVMLAIAVVPLWRLRAVEHHLGVAARLEPVPDA